MAIKTNCRICSCYCGVEIELNENEIKSIRGDAESFSKGFICRKGLAYMERLKNKDIKTPMIRNDKGVLRKVDWDEAIEFAANKLKPIIDRNPESLAIHSGDSYYNNDFSDMAKVFLNSINSPNFSDSGSYCNLARDLANILLHGNPAPKPNYENAETIILWGSNPRSSNPRYAKIMEERDVKLVVIDPVKNNLAKKADLYIQIRPGSDGALALGVLNILFERNLIDESYWSDNAIGLKEFKNYVKKFDLINTQIITWVEAEKILALANIYQNSKSLSSSIGVAIELQTNAVNSIRAIMALDILNGFLNDPNSNIILKDNLINRINIESSKKAIGESEFPILRKFFGLAQINRFSKAVLDKNPYNISALIAHNCNPALTLPNTNEIIKSFKQLDFLIYIGNQMNETSEYADLILPMTNMYEIDSLLKIEKDRDLYIKLARKALEPEFSENKFFIELSKKIGCFDNMLIKTEDELFKYRIEIIDYDFKKSDYYRYGKYEEDDSPLINSKKLELSSSILNEYGYNPMIEFEEPNESMLTNPPNAEFIFTATTGTRAGGAEIMDDGKKIKIASADKAILKKYHKNDGDLVTISSPRGSINMIVRLSDRICPNTISIPQATSEQNPNKLVDNEILDPIIGYPGCRSFLIKLEK
ncbi:MAG: molybdopterin-dependent oxidoreductase [Andreesenia angusta]|nr:molybdopterin-dependent oxidoreductase [Andreesenia angusta]